MGHVGVDDGRHRKAEAGVDGGEHTSPVALFFADALIDQHIGVHRHAHGQHDTGDTGQGQRGAEHGQDRHQKNDVEAQRDIGEQAEHAVARDHEQRHQNQPGKGGIASGLHRIGAKLRAHRTLFQNFQRRGQGACAQQNRQIVGALRVEIAGDFAGAAKDRLPDHRRGNHLVVEHDGKAAPDIGLGHIAELPRADGIEAEGHHRLAGLLVEGCRRIGQPVAGHHHPFLDQKRRHPLRAFLRQQFIADRNDAALGLGHIAGLVHKLERHLGGLAQQFLQAVGVRQARHLHQNALVALTFDGGFARAHLVDPAAHHFDRLAHGLGAGLVAIGIGDAHHQPVLARRRDLIFA